MNGPPSPSDIPTGMEEGASVPFERYCGSEGEDELSEVEADVVFLLRKLEMERDEETDDQEDGGEESDADTETDQEGSDHGSDYIPTNLQGAYKRAGAPNSSETFMRKEGTKHNSKRRRKKNGIPAYEFCPLQHRPSILRLLTKHFCQHPLLPERHGEPRTAELIYSDSVHEAYLYCKNNHLREVWAYLWTSWYAPDKWKLWARSAHPYAIPRKRTTMVVEAMWRNLKRLVLHLHNRPRVDFVTFSLVTQALPLYRHKLSKILNDPRKGRAGSLSGEQIPIKKAWIDLYHREANGHYDINVLQWTCSCGNQKYHSYLLCKHLVKKFPLPKPEWWTTVYRRHTPPFYDILDFLSAEERARAPKPEELGNLSWLARMPDAPVGANTPVISTLPVCTVHLVLVYTHPYCVGAFLTNPTASYWC